MILYHKSLFVHVPKTGGSWITEVILNCGGTKYSYSHDLPQNNKAAIFFNNYKPYCFVRHPLEILCSFWKHWSGDPNCRKNNLNKNLYWQWDKREYGKLLADNIVEEDFEQTVYNFCNQSPGFISFILDKYSRKCKYIGKYEKLEIDLFNILYKINGKIDQDLFKIVFNKQAVNVSKGKNQLIDKSLALDFMAKEIACVKYEYSYFPEFVL